MKSLIAALLLLSLAGPALAAGGYADEPLPNQGSSGPGGLGAADVTGKRLLDANGMEIGVIGGVADNGATALVRTPQGAKLSVPMSELSLGNGPNTVIRSGGSDADRLNRMQLQH